MNNILFFGLNCDCLELLKLSEGDSEEGECKFVNIKN